MCDDSPPIGYVAPASETKVPYSETPVGQPPHVDIFDTNLASSKLQNGVNQTFPFDELKPAVAEDKQDSIPDVQLETEKLTSQSHSSTQVNLENFAALHQRVNFEIPATEEVRQEESKVQFNMPQHRVH